MHEDFYQCKLAHLRKCCAPFKIAYSNESFAYTILKPQLCISKKTLHQVSSMYLSADMDPEILEIYIYILVNICDFTVPYPFATTNIHLKSIPDTTRI